VIHPVGELLHKELTLATKFSAQRNPQPKTFLPWIPAMPIETMNLHRHVIQRVVIILMIFLPACDDPDHHEKIEEGTAKSIHHLIELLKREQNEDESSPPLPEVLTCYDEFWEKHGYESHFSAKVAIAGIPAMRQAGRIDGAMLHLQRSIYSTGKIPGTSDLETAIHVFNNEFLKTRSHRELTEFLYSTNFGHGGMGFRAMIRIQIICAYEKRLHSQLNPEQSREAHATIKTLYEELYRDFKLKDLSNLILTKIGRYYRLQNNERIARSHYKEILSRAHDPSYRSEALIGLAELNADGIKQQQIQALKLLGQALENTQELSLKERALYLLASIHSNLGDHEKAIDSARAYLDQEEFRRYKTVCRMILAKSYQASGQTEKALLTYQQVFMSSGIPNRYLAPAIQNWMELLWERNDNAGSKSDR
jgi:tetratricopeptide (TPR) repeat protein